MSGQKKYEGLPDPLRRAVLERDGHRCRWCGATNRGADLHHISYRRGFADDVAENLVSLCRSCHNFVHGNPRPSGATIVKAVAQDVLFAVIATPGLTGAALWRRKKREYALRNLCEHGAATGDCRWCSSSGWLQ